MGGAAVPIISAAAQVLPAAVGMITGSKRKQTQYSSGLDPTAQRARDFALNMAMQRAQDQRYPRMPQGIFDAQALLRHQFLPGLGDFKWQNMGPINQFSDRPSSSSYVSRPRTMPMQSPDIPDFNPSSLGGPPGIINPQGAPNLGGSQTTGGFRGGIPPGLAEIMARIRGGGMQNPWMR